LPVVRETSRSASVEASNRLAHATVLDINGSMLAVGSERAAKKKLSDNLTFVEANAEELPFEANSFDAYTIAFGIRNVPRIDVALKEAHRVLKRGGRLLVLEFSEVDLPLLDRVYDAWSFQCDPALRQGDHRRKRALPNIWWNRSANSPTSRTLLR